MTPYTPAEWAEAADLLLEMREETEHYEAYSMHARAIVCAMLRECENVATGKAEAGNGKSPSPAQQDIIRASMSADEALAIADGKQSGDVRIAAQVLAHNARWYYAEYEKWRKVASGKAENTTDYSISLQQAIEFHSRGLQVPPDVMDRCPHHAKILNENLANVQAPPESYCASRHKAMRLAGWRFCEVCQVDLADESEGRDS
jgi:hypothetical protein